MIKSVILIGNGCRGNPDLVDYLCSLGIPILTTWQAMDLVPEDCLTFCGRPGVIGQRAANIIQQKANSLYCYGVKLDLEQAGWDLGNFAPRAVKYVFDVDQAELDKLPGGPSWVKGNIDLCKAVGIGGAPIPGHSNQAWLEWCMGLYVRFRPELDGGIYTSDSGMQSCIMMQAFKVKRGQRVMLCNTIGAMGMEPMAIGAAIASGRQVVVVTGDGGFSLNMQELEIVRREKLDIKYFVFHNGGYGSVVSMQDARFGRRFGADLGSGFTTPTPNRIASAFDLPYSEIMHNKDCLDIFGILQSPGPAIIKVLSPLVLKYACKMGSTLKDNKFILDPMEDMTPKIDDLEELMAWGNE